MDVRDLNLAELKPPLNVTLVKDRDGLEAVRDFFKRVPEFGFDVETNVVPSFVQRKVRTVQVGTRDEQFVIDLLQFAESTDALMQQGWRSCGEWAQPVCETLREGLESGKHLKVGVNLQFDYETSWWCLGLRPWHFYDGLLAEKVIMAGIGFWGGMDDLLLKYAKLRIDKTLQTSFDLETPLTPEQVIYAALDTRLSLAIKAGQKAEIEKAGLKRTVDLENEAIPAFGDMHVNGFLLDRESWMKIVDATKAKHVENVKELDKHFVPVVGLKREPKVNLAALEADWRNQKNRDLRAAARKRFQEASRLVKAWQKDVLTYEGEAAINYASGPQLLEAFRKMGIGVKKMPNTDDGILKRLAPEYPAVKALQVYRKTAKILSTYGEDFLEHINPDTGRVHAVINQIGAKTGRTSSNKPNIQNIITGSDFRDCFKARPGYKLITSDMSGAELRIMADASGEKSWLDAFHKDWDVHSMGAEMMFGDRWTAGADEGCPYVAAHKKCSCKSGHKDLRNRCKAINFKVSYGGEDLSENLGITKAESDALLRLWRKTFPTLAAYLTASGQKAKMTCESRTLCGRRRLYRKPTWEWARELLQEDARKRGEDPLLIGSNKIARKYAALYSSIEREGKNTPIQGANADIAKKTMGAGFDKNGVGCMWHGFWSNFRAELVNFVHDEFVVECPEENAEECSKFMGDCIRRGGAEFLTKVTMEYESTIADRWKK
jgi:DNA polymerase-1